LRLFKKHEIKQFGFWTVAIGESNNDLFLILQWESLAEREQKFGAFLKDPEWLAVRRKSEENGQGFPEAAARIQELFLAGRKDEAAAAVPDELIDLRALVGTPDRIRTRYRAWEDSGATGLLIESIQDEAIELMAELADRRRNRNA
jgi:alkanesulfonate monooxygenase SsuD/methylene tetrahydromethanopterin reductase-like flavin-dependent oxidoreductase (luciferase family)